MARTFRWTPKQPQAGRPIGQGVLCLLIWCLGVLSGGDGRSAEPVPAPVSLTPYAVRLSLAVDHPALSAQGRRDLFDEVRASARRCLGVQWQLELHEDTTLHPVTADGLRRRPPPEDRSESCHVEIALHGVGAAFQLDARGYQAITGTTPIESQLIYDPRDLALAILSSAFLVVRPMAIVESVDGPAVRAVLRAGDLVAADEDFNVATASRHFVPMLVSRTREGLVDRVQEIPWTIVTRETVTGGRMESTLRSGLRSPIGGKQRGRVQTILVGIRSRHPETVLELATQARPSLPLIAHRIEIRPNPEIARPDQEAPDATLERTLLTDRRGTARLKQGTEVVWLFAYSGRQLLARVPVLPGMAERLRLEVPDDSARLAAETELSLLQGELIEAVAERNTVAARVRAAVKKNQADVAKAAAAELRALPDTQVYLNRVTEIRVPALKAAKARRDRAGEARIGRLCEELNDLIKVYLSEDKRNAVYEELKELFAEDAVESRASPQPNEE